MIYLRLWGRSLSGRGGAVVGVRLSDLMGRVCSGVLFVVCAEVELRVLFGLSGSVHARVLSRVEIGGTKLISQQSFHT